MHVNRSTGLAAGGLLALAVLAAAGSHLSASGNAASAGDGTKASASGQAGTSSVAASSTGSRVSARASASASAHAGPSGTRCATEAEASVTENGKRKTVREARRATGAEHGCSAKSGVSVTGGSAESKTD